MTHDPRAVVRFRKSDSTVRLPHQPQQSQWAISLRGWRVEESSASRMRWDQDDAIVRRRLRTRVDIVFDDTAAIAPPTEAQLQAYLDAHPDAFRQDSRTSFVQVYLSPERHGDRMEADLKGVKTTLDRARPETDVAALDDLSMLDTRFDAASERDLVRNFAEEFARGLAGVPLDGWSGAIRSGYGAHFVRVTARTPGRPAKLEEVREAVQRQWLSEETTRAREAAHQRGESFRSGVVHQVRGRYSVAHTPQDSGREPLR